MTHDLKTWPAPFDAVWHERKRFEIRQNDRNFKIGDLLRLREWHPIFKEYSGREVLTEVEYIAEGAWGLPDGMCVMSIRTIERKAKP